MNINEIIKSQISDSVDVKNKIYEDEVLLNTIADASDKITECYKNGHMLLLCGNGGSAGDAQHIAGEMVARFRIERKALSALAFNTNSSVVTAIGNDYEYNKIFERQVEAFGHKGDVLIAISTSGNSESVVRAINKAKEMGITTVSLLGKNGGDCKDISDYAIVVPSDDTARIQESHIMIGHIICDLVERSMFGDLQ
ncbi:MAG: D-sedoheptulose 7-phosphate isomerase [Lachnospiraceae bacterium]|nr:D-sedoheptulose 7-phosphate isomerase [Lachnospiraceae bacterium]